MVVFVTEAVTVGAAFTVTAMVLLEVQLPVVPVTVYTVVLVGLTLKVGVLTLPGNQA